MLPYLQTESPAATRLVFSPNGAAKLKELEPASSPLEVLIGPEGGLSENEMQRRSVRRFSADIARSTHPANRDCGDRGDRGFAGLLG